MNIDFYIRKYIVQASLARSIREVVVAKRLGALQMLGARSTLKVGLGWGFGTIMITTLSNSAQRAEQYEVGRFRVEFFCVEGSPR